ncbi:hypothetical protein [Kitasatospora nipponensis]|uniref:hypothetical protein n=1 Tax=Kitasatospora nipponensis TaxID=258049 RepID=UPI0031D8D6B6
MIAAGAAVLVVAGTGYAFADNIAGLGAYRYVTPREFEGLPVEADSPLTKRIQQEVASGAADPKAFGASYGSPSSGYVMVMGYQRHDFWPSSSLADALRRGGATNDVILHAHRADPGARGGAMACGIDPPSLVAQPSGICLWADGSMQAMFSEVRGSSSDTLTLDQVEADARAFRLLAEQPG